MDDQWYAACQSSDLRKKPLAVTILGRHLVLFRNAAGQAAALEDRCAHRGAPLSGGTVEDGHLACPYHGWRYGADGALAMVPSLPPACPLPAGAAVPSFTCVEQDGFVWLCPSVPRQPTPRPFPFLNIRPWSSFVMRTLFRAPVEACLENFLDCPHATTVHRGWFRSPTAQTIRTVVRPLPDGAEVEYFNEPREKSLVWSLLAPSREHRMRHVDRFIAPHTTEVEYQFSNQARYFITSTCTPVNDGETLVFTVITFRFSWLTPLIHPVFRVLARRIIQQDVRMLDSLHLNTRRFGRPRLCVIDQDLLLPHIVRWRNALKRGSVPAYEHREEHVDLRL